MKCKSYLSYFLLNHHLHLWLLLTYSFRYKSYEYICLIRMQMEPILRMICSIVWLQSVFDVRRLSYILQIHVLVHTSVIFYIICILISVFLSISRKQFATDIEDCLYLIWMFHTVGEILISSIKSVLLLLRLLVWRFWKNSIYLCLLTKRPSLILKLDKIATRRYAQQIVVFTWKTCKSSINVKK